MWGCLDHRISEPADLFFWGRTLFSYDTTLWRLTDHTNRIQILVIVAIIPINYITWLYFNAKYNNLLNFTKTILSASLQPKKAKQNVFFFFFCHIRFGSYKWHQGLFKGANQIKSVFRSSRWFSDHRVFQKRQTDFTLFFRKQTNLSIWVYKQTCLFGYISRPQVFCFSNAPFPVHGIRFFFFFCPFIKRKLTNQNTYYVLFCLSCFSIVWFMQANKRLWLEDGSIQKLSYFSIFTYSTKH